MNLGAFPHDPNSPVGRVRLLVGDTDPAPLDPAADPATYTGDGQYLWYSDAEITALIDQFRGNVARTAAHIVTAIARSQSLLLKKWSSADLAVDGAAITRALLATATSLEDDAKRIDAMEDGAGGLSLVPTGGYSFAALTLAGVTVDVDDQLHLPHYWAV